MGTDPTGAKVELELRVDPSERARHVAVRFAMPASPPGASVVRAPIASERATTELPPAHPTRNAAYVSGALGLVGVAVGAVAGVVALVKTDSLKDRCQGNLCLSRDRADADAIRPYTTVATLGFGSGEGGARHRYRTLGSRPTVGAAARPSPLCHAGRGDVLEQATAEIRTMTEPRHRLIDTGELRDDTTSTFRRSELPGPLGVVLRVLNRATEPREFRLLEGSCVVGAGREG